MLQDLFESLYDLARDLGINSSVNTFFQRFTAAGLMHGKYKRQLSKA